jgi:hypothetical protein
VVARIDFRPVASSPSYGLFAFPAASRRVKARVLLLAHSRSS